jgi:hypothetical protein
VRHCGEQDSRPRGDDEPRCDLDLERNFYIDRHCDHAGDREREPECDRASA